MPWPGYHQNLVDVTNFHLQQNECRENLADVKNFHWNKKKREERNVKSGFGARAKNGRLRVHESHCFGIVYTYDSQYCAPLVCVPQIS